jgi:hypothetical protein
MSIVFKGVASVLANIAMTMLSRKIIEYITFSFLEWLVKRTDTKYDDELLEKVKTEYYSDDAK